MAHTVRKAGVVGWPIGHSLSPVLHRKWLADAGIHGSYDPVEAEPHDFAATIEKLVKDGWMGVNVTIPHKIQALELADHTDEAASLAGAANTLFFQSDGRIRASNSDGYGFVAHLQARLGEAGLAFKGNVKILILGAGGAARGIVPALAGLESVTVHGWIANRTRDRASQLATECKMRFGLDVEGVDLQSVHDLLPELDLLVNTTSLGMSGQAPMIALPEHHLFERLIVYDLVYRPLETELLRWAKRHARLGIDGLGMLIHQAVPGFCGWFDPSSSPRIDDELHRFLAQQMHQRSIMAPMNGGVGDESPTKENGQA
ncbi:MAG: shikimate dehydrogenase [Pseudomonadota bacterium]